MSRLKRVRWRDARLLSHSLPYRVLVWLGVLHSPSLHMFHNRCTRCRRKM